MEEKKLSLQISIIRISDQGFFVNENVALPDKTAAGLDIRLRIDHNFEEEKLGFIVEAIFYAQQDRSQVLLSGIVRTDYQAENLKKLKSKDSTVLDIPDQPMITMLSIAISHLRAVLTKNISSTVHKHLILPIVNPAEIYHHFKNNPVAHEKAGGTN